MTVAVADVMITLLDPVVIFPKTKLRFPANERFDSSVVEPADLFTIRLFNDPVEEILCAFAPVRVSVELPLVREPEVIIQLPDKVSVYPPILKVPFVKLKLFLMFIGPFAVLVPVEEIIRLPYPVLYELNDITG